MSSGGYPYPTDEFDAPAMDTPRGVHRAPRSRRERWLPFVAVLLAFSVLAYGLVTWLSDWEGLPGALGTGGEPVAEEPAGGADDPAAPTTETPTEEPTEEQPVEEPVETTPPPPAPDPSRAVQVLNATTISGLAGGAADRLEGAGFTTVSSGNWGGETPATSTVFYPVPEDAGTAQAVAEALGIATVTESADVAGDGLVVALTEDYQP